MRALLVFLEKQPLLVALSLYAVPYVGLRLYVGGVMHADAALAEAPGAGFLGALVGIGSLLPAGFLCLVLRRLVAERNEFKLGALLEVYVSVVLVFAGTYAVLQAGGQGPAFTGMPLVWESGAPASAEVHLSRLHDVFGNALYLSIVSMTTVGYGDVVPLGFGPKALAALQGLLGIGFVGLVLGQYFAVCLACRTEEQARSSEANHG